MSGQRIVALGVAGLAVLGLVGVVGGTASAAGPPRRVVVTGTVYQMDDESFGSNERCHHSVSANNVVYVDHQVSINESRSCGGEVQTTVSTHATSLADGSIRYSGEVILREGTCGCDSDPIRLRKEIDQVIVPGGNSRVGTGYMQWGGGDATEVTLQVSNLNP